MYFLKFGRYDLALCKIQTKNDQIIKDNINVCNLHKICESLIYSNPIKVELQ